VVHIHHSGAAGYGREVIENAVSNGVASTMHRNQDVGNRS
jgi:hypothetical protein